jgi:hypothetical protein
MTAVTAKRDVRLVHMVVVQGTDPTTERVLVGEAGKSKTKRE